jgi:DNA-binding NtrC family response regulator
LDLNVKFRLLVWSQNGDLLLAHPVEPKTFVVSGHDDADAPRKALGADSVLQRLPAARGTISRPHALGIAGRELTLVPGAPVKAGNLTWLLTRLTDETSVHDPVGEAEASTLGALLDQLVPWLAKPMIGTIDLRNGLNEFLSIIVKNSPATNGMLVLATGQGFSLASAFGLLPREAQQLWEKMPHALAEEVMRTKARVILPDELRRSRGGDSTVFIKNVRSVAGFPVLAEGRLVAVFYLGFDNLLKHLSHDLQAMLETAASVLGLVIQRAQLREQVEDLKLRSATTAKADLPAGRLMVGSSDKLIDVYAMIGRLAPVDVATLITGETGTGKELAAKELHRLSPRREAPFVVVNAAALPENLSESELFGHKKGAFTGALTDRVGLVEQAHKGTLVIDEIGELSLALQAKLLRVLQEYVVTRVGESEARPVNFRLVTATHRNLEEMVAAGQFREDLFYRIAGAIIRMPALRERKEDIAALANYFRQQFAERHGLPDKEWSQEALAALEANPWAGNVRELENVVSRAFVMAEGTVIRRRDLGVGPGPNTPAAAGSEADDEAAGFLEARDSWTKSVIARALKRHGGKRADTAKALGIGERTLFRYLEQFGIRDA